MTDNALGEEFDALAIPPDIEAPTDHDLWPQIEGALKEIYDPEIPVNIYELGLIYKVDIAPNQNEGKENADKKEKEYDLSVLMTLTSPGCPVAQEMPGWVQGALFPIKGVGNVDVDLIWDPPWDPSKMAETAKLQLNMFM